MATYTSPPMDSLPFGFGAGGYTKPDFDKLAFDFRTRTSSSATGYMSASINAIGQDYVKECPTYVVGYGRYGVQIIKGRCIYGGFRDMGAYLRALKGQQVPGDLPALIVGTDKEKGTADLPASVTSFIEKYLTANITGHYPANLTAEMRVWQRVYQDLPVSIHGWQTKDLTASLLGIIGYDLPASVVPIPPKDLSAYLKVWPQMDLPGSVYGWDYKDLGARITAFYDKNLSASIGTHSPVNLTARLKGYGREVPADLPAYLIGVAYRDLPASIRATYLKDLPASIFAIAPKDLSAVIHGYQTTDLPASMNVIAWPYNLTASITGSGGYHGLIASINGVISTNVFGNLGAYLTSWYEHNLQALVNVVAPADLGGQLVVGGGSSDLAAYIYPKMIRLSTVISLVTMEAKDMSAVINVCGGSGFKNLGASMTYNHIKDLVASIYGRYSYSYQTDLNAKIGYADSYFVLDKLPLSITIANSKYRVYDRISLRLAVSRQSYGLWASIVGEYTSSDLSATLTAAELDPVNFEDSKNRERVYFNLGKAGVSYETVEFSFSELVRDYFFNSATSQVYKTDPLDRWITNVESFIPEDKRMNVKRRLHKGGVLHDIERFSSIDEAVRYIIDYVTFYPKENLTASITATGQFIGLGASINV